MSNYVIGLISVITYLVNESDWIHTMGEIALGFMLLGYSTMLMPSIYIIIKESSIDTDEFR
eukprot:CAMPEP_0116872444 /NCGR_PEP_ID=MMETSP0463-20121206/3198_1 /TAXON_ID=181622 /ORGANISM="Strombidinopsis sp, Strain SopsisLIS2011" /LENGTH=60 /DNA_ID=CAMNT_0004512679 /DNA_START=314 /DNA_END=496 /DNA_ORIENTATION=-